MQQVEAYQHHPGVSRCAAAISAGRLELRRFCSRVERRRAGGIEGDDLASRIICPAGLRASPLPAPGNRPSDRVRGARLQPYGAALHKGDHAVAVELGS